jgi:hypothetical protein
MNDLGNMGEEKVRGFDSDGEAGGELIVKGLVKLMTLAKDLKAPRPA